MRVSFLDQEHADFFAEKDRFTQEAGHTADSYSRSFFYLCGLCPDTRTHFRRLFDWDGWCIRPEGLGEGCQTGTSRKITRLAFNLWNGYGQEIPDRSDISASFLPDEVFCCPFQPYFFEAIRLRFPEYSKSSE